jgi:flagellin
MNELATQAANGTNSSSDRESIQNEIDQLTTEIDRVAETTKFNETYLLKGNGKTSTVNINAQDAGINGSLTGVGTGTAIFKMDILKYGQSITIGSQGYTIGTTISNIRDVIRGSSTANINIGDGTLGTGSIITINGTEYKIADADTYDQTENVLWQTQIASLVSDGDKVVVGTQTFVAMTDSGSDGVGDNDASVISASHAYKLITNELRKASSIGADAGHEAKIVTDTTVTISDGISVKADASSAKAAGDDSQGTQVTFVINEGTVKVEQGLQVGLHVGADADETNKISFTIDTMNSAGLGIQNLNLVDDTGAKATYAIDAISDAISKVSATRSKLGAIQNRLEHTINNLDNVVENTTSAESEIRDTDMAEEMVEYSKNNILAQAGQSMLAQANQSNQGVLSLLG